jgi:hypothetical protein
MGFVGIAKRNGLRSFECLYCVVEVFSRVLLLEILVVYMIVLVFEILIGFVS